MLKKIFSNSNDSIKKKLKVLINEDYSIAKKRAKIFIHDPVEQSKELRYYIKTIKDIATKYYAEAIEKEEFEIAELISIGYLYGKPLISERAFYVLQESISDILDLRFKVEEKIDDEGKEELKPLVKEIKKVKYKLVNEFINEVYEYLIKKVDERINSLRFIIDYKKKLLEMKKKYNEENLRALKIIMENARLNIKKTTPEQ